MRNEKFEMRNAARGISLPVSLLTAGRRMPIHFFISHLNFSFLIPHFSFTLLYFSFLILFASPAFAQDDPEYRMEVGGAIGLAAYQGDFGGALFKQMQPMGSLVAKYKMNPRMAWAANLGFGKLKGRSDATPTWYPDYADAPIEFSTSLTNFDVRFEYNFWAFGTGREYRGARPLAPFIAFGMGLCFANCDGTAVGFEMPLGFGVKYKLADRLNLTAEWTMHLTGTDKLDGVSDPYGIKSSGLFKNTDCYSLLQVALTYDIWAKCKTCHNDNE